jgi:hypothetical protein
MCPRLDKADAPLLVKLLDLLIEIGVWPADFSTAPFARHADSRVRLAALRVALHFPVERERALCIAIAEGTGDHLRIAVADLKSGVPDASVPLIANRLGQHGLPVRERAALLRSLEGVRSPIAKSALQRAATTGRTWFGRPRLAAPTDASLAALATLAATWAGDARVDAVLKRAARSNDPQVRRAAAGALG